MFAVVRTGGKQYRVEPGSIVEVEKLSGDVGAQVELGEVLLFSNGDKTEVGKPLLSGFRVQAEIVEQKKDKKLIIFKKLRRQGYHLKKGHRQSLTRLRVKEILQG